MKRTCLAIVCVLVAQAAGWAQAPISLKASVFTMDKAALVSMMKEGFSRAELTDLQTSAFEKGALNADAKPVEMSSDAVSIKVPAEKRAAMQNAGMDQAVVLLLECTRTGEIAGDTVPLEHHDYAVTTKDGNEIEVLPRKGEWTWPMKSAEYRIVDFRYSSIANHEKLVYNITTSVNGESISYQLILQFAGE
ncbi:MAG: hypothetical protein GC154_11580 [bacterium]|nr:hypothetical protein [bacterium]